MCELELDKWDGSSRSLGRASKNRCFNYVYLAPSQYGTGAFAKNDIKRGCVIGGYGGYIATTSEIDEIRHLQPNVAFETYGVNLIDEDTKDEKDSSDTESDTPTNETKKDTLKFVCSGMPPFQTHLSFCNDGVYTASSSSLSSSVASLSSSLSSSSSSSSSSLSASSSPLASSSSSSPPSSISHSSSLPFSAVKKKHVNIELTLIKFSDTLWLPFDVAIRDIAKGEEYLKDYGSGYWFHLGVAQRYEQKLQNIKSKIADCLPVVVD